MNKVSKATVWMLLGVACGLAGTASANELSTDGSVRAASLEVRERLTMLERIHVTSEKPADPTLEAPAPELALLLDEIERIEQSDSTSVSE